jgi:transposase InsO family protein
MSKPSAQEHAREVAIFRSEIIGSLRHRMLQRGELQQELQTLSQQTYRPPGSVRSQKFSVPTLQRWYYAYKRKGLDGLLPKLRQDRGRGRKLTPELLTLLVDIRRENPEASVPLIVRTLQNIGRMETKESHVATVRRLFVERGLDRDKMQSQTLQPIRLRWEASGPNALWHADVCHGPTLQIAGGAFPLRIHALLDDASRLVLTIAALDHEREEAMLHLLVRALRAHGRPEALYLDNGATYSGDLLRTVCTRLNITLLHAKPYDPQARGKMERFWRTLRAGCLAFVPISTTVPEVQQRLDTFLQQHYQSVPHASLMGQSPLHVYRRSERTGLPVDEPTLRQALTVRLRRRVRNDTTLSIKGKLFELEQGYLAGTIVTVGSCLLDGSPLAPWVEHEGRRFPLHPCDPKGNSGRRRKLCAAPALPRGPHVPHVPFDPCDPRRSPVTTTQPALSEDDHDDDLSDLF